jgi:hypothetical protein
MRYFHRQVGWMTAGPVMVVTGALTWAFVEAGIAAWALVPLLLVLIIVGLFGSLAVAVDHESVRLRFGAGLIRKRIPIARISDCRIVRNKWYYGWGIRLTPRGWMWNISGLDAVELDLDDGGHFRIGTDDPDGLRSAIRRASEAR